MRAVPFTPLRGVIGLAVLVTGLLATVPAIAQEATGDVTVVHAFRGLTADVYLNGEPVLEGFAPERITDPLALPAGSHEVRVYEAGSPTTEAPVVAGTLEVVAGTNASAVVHAAEGGEPQMSVFVNNVAAVPAGSVRLAVRHTAASGPVDVLLDGEPFASAIAAGAEATKDVPASVHQVAVTQAGTSEPLMQPSDVDFAEGTVMSLYLIGSASDDSLAWLAQTIEGAQSAPASVATGNSGLVAPSTPPVWVGVAPLAAVALGFAVLGGRRRRTPRAGGQS